MQNLLVPFIFQEECCMKTEYVLFPSLFTKLRICVLESHFYCSHVPIIGTNKMGSFKSDLVNVRLKCISNTIVTYV